jgi:hypothetical protein
LPAEVEKPRGAAFAYVVVASLVMLVLQVTPWSGPFLSGFFNAGDTPVYAVHGSWVVTGKLPYVEIPIPYPPLDVVLNGLPHLLPFGYRAAFVLVDFAIFWALLAVYWRSVRRGLVAATSASVVLLGLPSVLYNVATFNDLRPAAAVLGAFLLLRARRFEAGIALLAASVFFKSYPLFLLPVAFGWVASQTLAPEALASTRARLRGVLAALASPAGLRLVLTAAGVALLIGGAATLWTGTHWLTAPAPNYGHLNPENPAYFLATYTPLGWSGALALVRALAAATVLGALVFVPLRSFENAVRVAIVVVIGLGLSAPFHSPHWNLWFMFLFPLLPISRRLLLVLVLYDLDNLLFWPLFSLATPIEALRPAAQQVWMPLIVLRCALELVLVAWLLRDARQHGGGSEPCRAVGARLHSRA